jgi:hypothetical protein
MSQNRGHHWPIVHPPGDVNVRAAVVVMLAGDNSWLVYQSSLAVLPADKSGASRRNGWRNKNFAYSVSLITSADLLRAIKCYDMGPPALFPIRRKVCCRFLSPLKIHRLSQVWTHNPWGPVANTLTTTPPRQLQTANWVAVWHSFPFIPTFGSPCNTFPISTCSSWINFNNNHNTKKTLNSHTWIIWIKTAVQKNIQKTFNTTKIYTITSILSQFLNHNLYIYFSANYLWSLLLTTKIFSLVLLSLLLFTSWNTRPCFGLKIKWKKSSD